MEITQRDLLAFNGMIITGMLFVFGLSSEISQKNILIYGMAFPFLTSIITVAIILNDQEFSKIVAYTKLSLYTLFAVIVVVFIDVIILDNYISNNITLKSWMKVDRII